MTATSTSNECSAATHHHEFHPAFTLAAFVLAGIGAVIARDTHISLLVLVAAMLGPDLSFLAAIGAPNKQPEVLPLRAVGPYNVAHHPAGPVVLTVAGSTFAAPLMVVAGVAWLSHLAWDRGLGYRLRNADGTISAREPTLPRR